MLHAIVGIVSKDIWHASLEDEKQIATKMLVVANMWQPIGGHQPSEQATIRADAAALRGLKLSGDASVVAKALAAAPGSVCAVAGSMAGGIISQTDMTALPPPPPHLGFRLSISQTDMTALPPPPPRNCPTSGAGSAAGAWVKPIDEQL